MQPQPIVIVYSPVGGGHHAAAHALAEHAKKRGERAVLLNAFDFAPKWFGEAYVGAHLTGQRAAPHLYGRAFTDANRRGGVFEAARLGFDAFTFRPLVQHVQTLRPKAVVATHHLPLIALAHARRTRTLAAPLTCVVTDFTAHAVWAERAVDQFCVAHPCVAHDLRAHGVRAPIAVTGIPVRDAFEEVPRFEQHAGHTRVLITSGGFGVGPLTQIIASFTQIPDVHLTVVCGHTEAARLRAAHVLKTSGTPGEAIGFERNMPERMRTAHVVIGKAGGLTVSESLTAGRPMLLVGTVPGNETANEMHVILSGAGARAEAHAAGHMVETLRPHLHGMAARAHASVLHRSAARVLEAVSQQVAEAAA